MTTDKVLAAIKRRREKLPEGGKRETENRRGNVT